MNSPRKWIRTKTKGDDPGALARRDLELTTKRTRSSKRRPGPEVILVAGRLDGLPHRRNRQDITSGFHHRELKRRGRTFATGSTPEILRQVRWRSPAGRHVRPAFEDNSLRLSEVRSALFHARPRNPCADVIAGRRLFEYRTNEWMSVLKSVLSLHWAPLVSGHQAQF